MIPQAILGNIFSRTFVQTGQNVLIGGFIVDGIVSKNVAVRALGPSLAAAGVTERWQIRRFGSSIPPVLSWRRMKAGASRAKN